MKNFIKNCIIFEPPLGEAWLVIVGVLVLLTLGFVSFKTAAEWVVIAVLFIGICIWCIGTTVVGES